jgi:hypothetical protein
VSFVDEIEEILQSYIRSLSMPLPYELHVLTAESGALEIQVGTETYSSPEEVPQRRARELIQAAVAEWEQQ